MRALFGEDRRIARARRISLAASILLLAVSMVIMVVKVRAHAPWEDIVRGVWVWLILAFGVMPVRWGFVVQAVIMATVLWVDLRARPMTLDTLKQLPWMDWWFVVCLVFIVVLAASAILNNPRLKRLPQI